MADERIIQSIVDKCEFLYDEALLSKETIIEKYLTFFASQFDSTERSVSFAFHTGSLCFDVVSVAALMMGCLTYEFPSNDEILADLEPGDMVLFRGERYHWGGMEKTSLSPGEPEDDYIILKQDAKGKNGPSRFSILYNQNKHLVKPYFGSSSVTDGRGIRKAETNRNDFISKVLGIPLEDVPTTLDLSVIVVADYNKFREIAEHLKIRYSEGKTVELMDVVPVSYYTGTRKQIQIGKNPSKAEAVIKVTSKMSMARELVLDKHGNRVIGLMVTNVESFNSNTAELTDLLRRKKIKFACVVAPYSSDLCELALEQYEDANMFACTKELLSGSNHEVKATNKLTEELNRQIKNILSHEITTVRVENHWNWVQYRNIKRMLYAIKQSDWFGEDRDNFILSTMALINLFSTAFFSMERMEDAISGINLAVVSPKTRIEGLKGITSQTLFMQEQCSAIVSMLSDVYSELFDQSPKEAALLQFLKDNHNKKIAIVVPKAYYADLFTIAFQNTFKKVVCITTNRFDRHEQYDIVIATGNISGKRFDPLRCFAAPKIVLFLYEFEEKIYSFKKKKAVKSERKLNARIKGLKGKDFTKAIETEDDDIPEITKNLMHEFSDLDDFVDSMGLFNIRKLTAMGSGGEASNTAEVKFVGTFITGEKILFSKYYSAVVFNPTEGAVTEKSPEKLLPGDILVFAKRNDYTRNIVDWIFDQLMRTKKLSANIQEAAEKALYWKTALREYKNKNKLTYKAIAKNLKKHGCSLKEVTIRQWLIEESHIIGPRDAETMKTIATVIQDQFLLINSEVCFEACRIVRRYRREILSMIAKAINDKLRNRQPVKGSVFEVVYQNVEKLSETMKLENVFELDEVAIINNGMVNRPIYESEVLT